MKDPYYNQPIPVQIRFSAKNIIGVIAALAAMDIGVRVASRQLEKLNKRLAEGSKRGYEYSEE